MGVRKKTKSHIKKDPSKPQRRKEGQRGRHTNRSSLSAGDPNDFQGKDELKRRIWQTVSMIPKGQVASYGQIAKLCGFPAHSRYVGRTLGNLPKDSKLPWYRVVNSQRKISQRGGGEARQKKLLEAEGVTFVGATIAKAHLWDASAD